MLIESRRDERVSKPQFNDAFDITPKLIPIIRDLNEKIGQVKRVINTLAVLNCRFISVSPDQVFRILRRHSLIMNHVFCAPLFIGVNTN